MFLMQMPSNKELSLEVAADSFPVSPNIIMLPTVTSCPVLPSINIHYSCPGSLFITNQLLTQALYSIVLKSVISE